MCRLLGIVSSAPVDFRVLLAELPRSLRTLGEEHKDGWGLAASSSGRWQVHKGTLPASRDTRFERRASMLRGDVLVSHVRKRTVGPTRKENSHPFARGRWVFAHNGTILDHEHVRARVSRERLAEIDGDTDSELFFAYLLTRFDQAGVAAGPASAETDRVLGDVARECRARTKFGSFNFLLSDGVSCYVHRFGRSLYLLERGPRDRAPSRRTSAVFVASEPMTDEAWRELDDGTLLRIERGRAPLSL